MNRLRDLREDADLTQTQVAAILHMSQTGYSKYETGENDIPTRVLIQLARFYRPAPITCWGSPTAGTPCKGGGSFGPISKNPGPAGRC